MLIRLINGCGVALVILLTAACGSTSVSQITAPDAARCGTSVGAVPTLPAAGGRIDVPVVTARECSWTANSNSSWIQISPASGQGEMSITLTGTANPQGTVRNGNISINGSQVAVSQAAAPCTFSVDPTSITVPATAGTASTRVSTLTGCTWTTNSPQSWAEVPTGSQTGPGQVDIGIRANPGTSPRTVNVVIAGHTVTITQNGTPVTPAPTPGPTPEPAPGPGPSPSPTPPPAPGPAPSPTPEPDPSPQLCISLIDPITRFVKAKGGDETVKVETRSTCSWKAVSNVSWIQIRGNGEGTGTRDVKYDVERNPLDRTRLGTISIAGLTHFVVQEPADTDD